MFIELSQRDPPPATQNPGGWVPGMDSSGGFKASMGQSSTQGGSRVHEIGALRLTQHQKFLHFSELSESFCPTPQQPVRNMEECL